MNLTDQTLELLKAAQTQPLQKAGITTGTGLVAYDLEPAAKLLYPVLTPLRNMIPRRSAQPGAGLATNWKQITGINTTNVRAGVSEGNRSAAITLAESNKIATYKGIGLENFVTFEADYAGRGFEDVKALGVKTLLQALMIQEEITILTGNTSLQLGVTPTPVGVAVAGGSILASATNFLYCVALTYQGWASTTVALGVTPTITRVNVDASVDTFGNGSGQISAQSAAITTTGGNLAISATVAAVKGAAGYAWYLGTATGAANALLAAVTTLNAVTLTAPAAGTQAANAAGLSTDNSTNGLDFDGLITQTLASTGYYKTLDNATMTADGFGGVFEIDAALQYFWDTYRISPTKIRCAGQVLKDITKKVLQGSTNPVFRINMQEGKAGQGNATAGSLVTSYLNKFAMGGVKEIPIELHPYMPSATIFFDLDEVPYPSSNVAEARLIQTRQEYYQTEWPLRTRKYEFGVYADEVLKVYVPFGMGLITNIAAG